MAVVERFVHEDSVSKSRPLDMPNVNLARKQLGDNIRKALTRDGKLLSVKEVEITVLPEDIALVEELENEIDILSTTSHVNIVQYRYFAYESVTEIASKKRILKLRMYMDCVPHHTLEGRYTDFRLTNLQVALYTLHILRGIDHLHDKNIVHRDIRCANIWVDDQGVCKLANFGKAKELRHRWKEIKTFSKKGNPHWMAPEIAHGKPYQKPVDIWSLGCTVLEMLTRCKPFGKDVQDIEAERRLKNGERPNIPDSLSETARNFVERCLKVEPDYRATTKDLLQDPFVNNPVVLNQLTTDSFPSPSQEVTNSGTGALENPDPFGIVERQPGEDGPAMSIEDMCRRMSEELKKNEDDMTAFVISSAWLMKWQSDDGKVYATLLQAGYVKTFETDTYACFENILSPPNIDCSDYMPTLTDEYLNDVVACESTQESTEDMNSSHPPDNVSAQNQINTNDLDPKSGDEAGWSGQRNVVFTTPGVKDSNDSGTHSCSENCPDIQLTVVAASSDGNICGRAASAYMKFKYGEYGEGEVSVPLMLSCCVKGNQLCIKFKCLKGRIDDFPEGTILKETRLTVAVMVDGKHVSLKPVDPDDNQTRVCSKGEAKVDFYKGKEEKFWSLGIRPRVYTAYAGAEIGEFTMTKDKKLPVRIFEKNASLELVTLKVGDSVCRKLYHGSVLVLYRNVAHTWLARECKELNCVDARANSRPIILEGEIDPEYLDSSGCNYGSDERRIEITCCAELYTDVIPDFEIKKRIEEEILCAVTRKQNCYKLCETYGHVTFTGKIPRN